MGATEQRRLNKVTPGQQRNLGLDPATAATSHMTSPARPSSEHAESVGLLQAFPPTRKLTSCPERLRPHSCRSRPPDLGRSGVQLRPLLPSSCLQMGKLRPSQGGGRGGKGGAWITLHNKFKSGTGPAGPADSGPACFTVRVPIPPSTGVLQDRGPAGLGKTAVI